MFKRYTYPILLTILCVALVATGCEPAAVQIIPTDAPTGTPTFTPSPTRTPGFDGTPTRAVAATRAPGEPTETPLFGAAPATAVPEVLVTPTRVFNPNAPRVEFFTSDPLAVEPGDEVSLFWSSRGVDNAVIYRLEDDDTRAQVYNVGPDGSLRIDTNSSERGALRFLLSVGQGANVDEEILVIPFECPVEWFFAPSPTDCANTAPIPSRIVDIPMERGRMIFVQDTNTVYALFNDGQLPAWLSFENRYDPEIHPFREEDAPPEFIQPTAELGFVWRGDADVRNRLGLGLQENVEVNGFYQTAPAGRNTEDIYITAANGVVVVIPPNINSQWQVLGVPQ